MRPFSELLSIIRDTISLPIDDEDRWNATAVLGAVNRAMDEKVFPDLIRFANEYAVARKVLPLRDASNGLKYPLNRIPIPNRAYAGIVRELKWLPVGKTERRDEVNVPLTSIVEFDSAITGGQLSAYVENNTINLSGTPESLYGSLVFYYFVKPQPLVNKTTQFASVTNVATTSLTLTSGGSEWPLAADTVGAKLAFDLLHLPSGSLVASDVILENNTSTYTVISGLPSHVATLKSYATGYEDPVNVVAGGGAFNLGLGEIVAQRVSQGSMYTYLPNEFDYLLCYQACSKILESLGDAEAMRMNEQRINDLYEKIKSVYSTRVKGERRKVVDNRGLGRTLKAYSRYNNWR